MEPILISWPYYFISSWIYACIAFPMDYIHALLHFATCGFILDIVCMDNHHDLQQKWDELGSYNTNHGIRFLVLNLNSETWNAKHTEILDILQGNSWLIWSGFLITDLSYISISVVFFESLGYNQFQLTDKKSVHDRIALEIRTLKRT